MPTSGNEEISRKRSKQPGAYRFDETSVLYVSLYNIAFRPRYFPYTGARTDVADRC